MSRAARKQRHEGRASDNLMTNVSEKNKKERERERVMRLEITKRVD